MKQHIFLITAGRTGSMWLSSFLQENFDTNVVHEPIGIDDFGFKMPNIRTMRHFNNFGNNHVVKDFWTRKFASIKSNRYAETNHTLCKCGLIENIIEHKREDFTTVIILKRNKVKQCLSYIQRNDFANVVLRWQFYLDPEYIIKLVDPKPFIANYGNVIGIPIWYCYEMLARQEFYQKKYADKVKFIITHLEDLNKSDKAEEFLNQISVKKKPLIPEMVNKKKEDQLPGLEEKIESIIKKIDMYFELDEIVDNLIKSEFSFNI